MAVLEGKSRGKEGGLPKCRTGIMGLDEITYGGLPRGRPTLICGGAGCGKTLFAMEFIVRGATEFNEPGVYVSFEEKNDELARNFASLGFDLDRLVAEKKLIVDNVFIERSEMEETGEYDLEGLFVRIGSSIDSIGAKRVVLDTIEALFSGFGNENILRAELRRLFRWLKEKGITAIITGERGVHTMTRYGLEEYVADAVIVLDHRVTDTISTRRLKVVKYRGSRHGTNEYPFMVGKAGLSVLPITSLGLDHVVSTERISSGVPSIDGLLDGKGYFRGSTILVSGGAGTGKTSIALHLINSACGRGERCAVIAFEESEKQIVRDAQSIGIGLQKWLDAGLLRFVCSRPQLTGLEMHLLDAHNLISDFKPDVVAIDPVSSLMNSGTPLEAQSMMTRLIDFMKMQGITLLMTDLSIPGPRGDTTGVGISSLSDAWIRLENVERGSERIRMMTILKSRGMNHSNRMVEFRITDQGLRMVGD